MTGYRDQVAEAVRAVVFRPRHRFAWLGESSPPLPRGIASALPESAARAVLLSRLRARLYESFYCPGGVEVVGRGVARASPWADPVLVEALSGANAGRGSWERGWRLDAADEDGLVVSRNGVRVRARRSECQLRGEAQRGTELSVALPREWPALSPGFFTALGDVNLDLAAEDLAARLYFNVSCKGAPALVAAVTSALNRARVPFRFKVADHPERFGRCDAAVLYLKSADVRRQRQQLAGIVDACEGDLRGRTPVFTKPLAPGVGLAEERGDATESFGMRRCRVLAEGLMSAHERRIRGLHRRLLVIENHFTGAGIDLDAPYLEAESLDGYRL
jgi:hypothetical protein